MSTAMEDSHKPQKVDETTPILEPKQRNWQNLKKAGRKLLPLLMVSGSSLIFCTQAVLSKLMPFSPGEYVLIESSFNICFCLLVCAHSGVDIRPPSLRERDNLWFWGRVILGGIASSVKIPVFRMMDIGDATAIFFTTPIWVGILARIILKEKFTVIDLFGSILGLIGIILIAKPGFLFTHVSSSRNTSLLWASLDLGLAIIGGLSYVCVRAARENIDP